MSEIYQDPNGAFIRQDTLKLGKTKNINGMLIAQSNLAEEPVEDT